MENSDVAIVIPARMGSKRLINKPLKDIAGKPLLKWVIESAQKVNFNCSLIVLTEDTIIKDFVNSLGVKCFLTNKSHKNGTERLLEIFEKINVNYFINLQGDEPLIDPNDIDSLYKKIKTNSFDVVSMCHEIEEREAENPSNVKVVLDKNANALYFSRAKIPHRASKFYCHNGIYAFKKDILKKIRNLDSSYLESVEDLEQLKWLENEISINMLISNNLSIGVDTPLDLLKAENIILANQIKGLICDIDGTLTNGFVWFGETGEELKSFNVKDGSAIKKLLEKDFKIGFLSGRDSAPLRARAKELGVKFTRFNQDDKKKGCLEILDEMKLDTKSIAYIGDDESDIPCCSIIPFSFAVKDSNQELKKISRFQLKKKGGEGVICEFIEKLNFLTTNSKI